MLVASCVLYGSLSGVVDCIRKSSKQTEGKKRNGTERETTSSAWRVKSDVNPRRVQVGKEMVSGRESRARSRYASKEEEKEEDFIQKRSLSRTVRARGTIPNDMGPGGVYSESFEEEPI
jgi:hypothetical protein